MNRWSEKLLARRIMAGDQEACVQLIRLHHVPVYRLLVRLCHDAHLAEDLTQETFAVAWAGIAGFRGSSSLGSWLYRIAYRKFVDARRRKGVRAVEDAAGAVEQVCSPGCRPLEAVLAEEQGDAVREALTRLDPDRRDALVLHYLQGLSYREMARVLDEPIGTIKGRVSDALAKLRAILAGTQENGTEFQRHNDEIRRGIARVATPRPAGAQGA